jgi:hypothetical protein
MVALEVWVLNVEAWENSWRAILDWAGDEANERQSQSESSWGCRESGAWVVIYLLVSP